MSARGCPDGYCVWKPHERVQYCLDCGRAMGCPCVVHWPENGRPWIVQTAPDCITHNLNRRKVRGV